MRYFIGLPVFPYSPEHGIVGRVAEEYDYPEDEFDRLARERTVLGAHREVKSKRPWWIAIVAIIVIVPLLAWIFVRAGAVDSVTDKVVTPSVTPTETPSETPTPEPSDQKSTDADDDKDTVDTTVEVRVLNGSGISGLAASKEEILNGEGFANTIADNYGGGSTPSQSTVYYAKEDDAATAEKVASTLGISEIVLAPESVSGGEGIVVVLRSDVA